MKTAFMTALAEPNRMRIVELLREGPCSVGEIARRLQLRQPQVSKHLRVLSEAGIVKVQPIAQQRVYRLEAAPFNEFDRWVETFRQVWETRFDNLDEVLQELKDSQKRDNP